jgi:hypothetical protein
LSSDSRGDVGIGASGEGRPPAAKSTIDQKDHIVDEMFCEFHEEHIVEE